MLLQFDPDQVVFEIAEKIREPGPIAFGRVRGGVREQARQYRRAGGLVA